MARTTNLPPILVVDVETTSDDRELAGIVEIAAIWLDETLAGKGPLSFEIKCRPRPHCEIQDGALRVNGCNWLKDKSVVTETEALALFAAFIGNREVILAGCNPSFDWHILKNGWRDAMQDTQAESPLTAAFPFSFRTLDLHSLAMADAIQAGFGHEIPDDGLKSAAICEAFGIAPESKPHRAMNGAAWEWKVLREFLHLD